MMQRLARALRESFIRAFRFATRQPETIPAEVAEDAWLALVTSVAYIEGADTFAMLVDHPNISPRLRAILIERREAWLSLSEWWSAKADRIAGGVSTMDSEDGG